MQIKALILIVVAIQHICLPYKPLKMIHGCKMFKKFVGFLLVLQGSYVIFTGQELWDHARANCVVFYTYWVVLLYILTRGLSTIQRASYCSIFTCLRGK